jgi:gliding motility-associated-like protein
VVKAYPKTVINLTETQRTICTNDSITLVSPLAVAPNILSYRWYLGSVDAASPQGALNQPWTVKTAGNYILHATDLNGCTATATFTLKVNKIPIFDLGNDRSTCEGIPVTLGISNSYVLYQWTNLDNPSQMIPNTQKVDVTTAGVYHLQAWLPTGCTNTDSVRLNVNPNPNIGLTLDKDSICTGENFTLSITNPTGLVAFEWSTNQQGVSSIVVTQPGSYSVKVYDANNCTDDTIIVLNAYKPVLTKLDDLSICADQTATLPSFTKIPTYQWYYQTVDAASLVGDENNPPVVNTAGSYLFRGVDINGCSVAEDLTLTVNALPIVNLGSDKTKCYGDTVSFVSKKDYVKYVWNGTDLGNQHYMTIQSVGNQLFTLEVTDKNGCTATDTIDLTVNSIPSIDVGNDILVCPGTVSTLTATTSASTILWSNGETTPTINVGHGLFRARVTDSNGCQNIDSVRVRWRQSPEPSLGPNIVSCPLERVILDPGDYQSYRWQNGSTERTIEAELADTVNMVTVADEFGCQGWDTKMVYHLPLPTYQLSGDTVMCANTDLTLDAGSEYPYFLWDNGSTNQQRIVNEAGNYWVKVSDGCVWARDTISISFLPMPIISMLDTIVYAQITIQAEGGTKPYLYSLNEGKLQSNNTFRYLQNGLYEVLVQDANGCEAIDTVEINSLLDIEIPGYLTPNGDGYNDTWQIKGIERFPDAEIYIFDRYGKQLAKLKGDSPGWDGRYMGRPMPSDDYWYVIHLVHLKKTIKGNLTLKR